AAAAGEAEAFRQAIKASRVAAPGNLLYDAWFHRLEYSAAQVKQAVIAWGWLIPLALFNGFLFWLLSDEDRFMLDLVGPTLRQSQQWLPVLMLLAAPISASTVMIYLTAAGRRGWRRPVIISTLLILLGFYVVGVYPQAGTRPLQEQYLTLMMLHIPLLAWSGVGALLLFDERDAHSRFAFIMKSLDVFIVGGFSVGAGGLFLGITFGLFNALGVEFATWMQRLLVAGGAGLLPVIGVAVIYRPDRPVANQSFDEGLSKLVALLMRLLLPLTLLVLTVYLAFIPFNFREPFDNRDVLIIYNGLLFAVAGLLVGATPVRLADLPAHLHRWLRLALSAVAGLTLLVGLYALTAIIYRTTVDQLTPNRLAFIGWNVINLSLLGYLLQGQLRANSTTWLARIQHAFAAGTIAYAAWSLLLLLAIPWLFGNNLKEADILKLPVEIQDLIFEQGDAPILLKCTQSPNIYLLDGTEKRWVKDIDTFNDRGYLWRDVHFVTCSAISRLTDGPPIPADAGTPPDP
ncbi:MAG: hypothetical protein KDE28_26850, partial [Anaerolineales bacterium]|nr:hypothetical protein [Anaerolineales bacterium]